MKHISEETIYNHIFAHQPLDDPTHLAHCDECRQAMNLLTTMANELAVLRLSGPTAAQLQHYQALFDVNSAT